VRPYPGRVVAFVGEKSSGRLEKLQAAWRRLPIADLVVQVVAGSHLALFEEPHVGPLMEQLKVHLRRARANGGPP
jgi:hypothetical protein